MACNSCAKTFSLLRKEKGCPSCGFSYCSKCLEENLFVQKLNSEVKVCAKCKRNASTSNTPRGVQPPDAYFKRLGVLDNNPGKNLGGNPKDHLILQRLQKLKDDKEMAASKSTQDQIEERLKNIKGPVVTASDAEIQERLAKLRGGTVEVTTSKSTLPPPDTRSEQQQIDDLMKEYMEQTEIDSKYKDGFDALVSDMETRMQKLKETNTEDASHSKKETDKEKVESEDEEEIVNKIVQKLKAEASLEDEISSTTHEELPFCEICNEDAQMRCLGCRYLFCKQCFSEHKDDDDGCDKYEPYKPPRTSTY